MELTGTITAHHGKVTALRFTSDGESLYSAGMDNTVHHWRTTGSNHAGRQGDAWQRHTSLAGHEKSVNALALTSDGSTLVTGSSDSTVRIWDTASGEVSHVLQDRKRTVAGLALSADDAWIGAASYKGRVAVWDVAGTTVTAFQAAGGNLTNVTFAPGNRRVLASAGLGSEIKVWALPDGEEITVLDAATAAVVKLRFLRHYHEPDGEYLPFKYHVATVS